MAIKTNKQIAYYLGEIGYDHWNDALDAYLEAKYNEPQITWDRFYTGRKDLVDSMERVKKKVKEELDKIQNSGIFGA